MESIGFYLKQVLAVVLSASLLSATVPPPSPAAMDTSAVRFYRQISAPVAASPAWTKKLSADSATLAMEPKLRSEPESNGASLVPGGVKPLVPGTTTDNPKRTATTRVGGLGAKRELGGQTRALDKQGLVFVENKGQFDQRVKFQVSNGGKTLWLTQNGIVLDFVKTERNQTRALPSEVELPAENRPSQGSAGNPKVQNPIGQIAGRDVIYENFVGANDNPVIETKRLEEGVRNYLSGNDPKKWQTDVRGFSEIVYHDVWKGVNLRLYGNGPNLEQEFIVAPGGEYGQVQIAYQGIQGLRVGKGGSLLIKTSAGQMRETAPRIYQRIAGRQTVVKGRFKLLSPTSYTFQIAKYDARQPLTIDPTLLYSTYLGGSAGNYSSCGLYFCETFNQEVATGIAVDTAGDAYVTGYTLSTDFPTTSGAFHTSAVPSAWNSFVTKLNPTGSGLIYSTYLNGTAGHAFSNAIAVDRSGNAYVTGYTLVSTGFPTTSNAYAPTCASGDFFIAELNPTGSGLVYSSCLNIVGTAASNAIAVDSNGKAYVTGGVGGSIPTTANAYQPSNPGGRTAAFVMVFDTTTSGTSSLMFSTYLVISGPPDTNFGVSGNGIALDSFGNIYITGSAGPYLPVTAGAFQPTLSGAGPCPSGTTTAVCPDAFVAKFNPSVSGTQSLIYSTYLGGHGPTIFGTLGNGIAVDSAGSAYVTGLTGSSMFPVTPGAFQTTVQAGCPPGTLQVATGCAFVSKLSPSGSSLIYSTYLAGNSGSYGNGIAVDSLGNAYVAGNFRGGGAPNPFFPVTPDAFQSSFTKLTGLDPQEAFLTKLNAAGSALIYSSYLGGEGDDVATAVAVDQIGDAYVVGHTSSVTFPVTPGAFEGTMHGTGDAFVTKFPIGTSLGLSITGVLPNTGGNSGTVTVMIVGSGFETGATVSLMCPNQTDIIGSTVAVDPNGRTLSATFNLMGTTPAACSLVVTNPDGTTTVQTLGFTIEQGTGPQVWVEIVGRTALRAGSAQQYFIVYGNNGDVDSEPTVIAFAAQPLQYIASVPSTQLLVDSFSTPQWSIFTYLVPSIRSRGVGAIPITLTALTDVAHAPFQVRVMQQSLSSLTAQLQNVSTQGITSVAQTSPSRANVPVNSFSSALLDFLTEPDLYDGCPQFAVPPPPTSPCPSCDLYYQDLLAKLSQTSQDLSSYRISVINFDLLIAQILSDNARALGRVLLLKSAAHAVKLYYESTGDAADAGQSQALEDQFGQLYDDLFGANGDGDDPSLGLQTTNAASSLSSSIKSQTSIFQSALANAILRESNPVKVLLLEGLESQFDSNLQPILDVVTTLLGEWGQLQNLWNQRDNLRSIVALDNVLLCNAEQALRDCSAQICGQQPTLPPPPPPCVPGTCLDGVVLVSGDPNDKTGSFGTGTQQYVSGATPIPYAIFWGNEPTATAPAQTVFITDLLPIGTDDLTSISLGPIVFGNHLLLPTSGQAYSTTVDLRPQTNLLVGISATLNSTNGQLSWKFTSLDPITGTPTTDPTAGFLPPGGNGSVFFTVTPKHGLPTQTQVQNQATVIFDFNAPISTPIWTNTLDITSPTSGVVALPTTEYSTSFTVKWTGSDVGAGIQDFTIFVSDNGGLFTPFQTNTTATSATFTGQVGHSYGFYSIAHDLVGNVETAKTAAEATTQVTTDTTPPVTIATLSPQPNAARWNNSNVTVALNSTDNEAGGTGVKQINYSATGAQTIANAIVAGSSASFTISTEGTTTIAFFGSDNAGNVETAKTFTIQLDKTPPTITGLRTPPPNANGWESTNVTVSFVCADSLSGLAPGSPPAPTTLSSEGAGQSVTGTCTDVAGNSASSTVGGINIDKTPPTVACSASPNVLWPPNNKLVPINVSVNVSDALSGPGGFTLVSVTNNQPDSGQGDIQGFVTGTTSTSGQLRAQRLGSGTGRVYTFTYSGTDRAGNTASCTTTVTVPHDQGHN